jgi:hypothetical protein
MLPQVGDNVTVVVRNSTSHMLVWYPATNTYHGKVIANPSWLDKSYFCITGDKRQPMRLLKYSNVVSITQGDVALDVPTVTPVADPVVKTYEISGSRGKTYKVTFKNGAWKCHCTAASFGRQCKHVIAASLK